MLKSTFLLLFLLLTCPSRINAQNVIFGPNDYKGIELEIELTPNSSLNDPTLIATFTNTTDSIRNILLKELMGFPMGIYATIIDENGQSIVENGSKHIYSSQLYTSEQLESEKLELKLNELERRFTPLFQNVTA